MKLVYICYFQGIFLQMVSRRLLYFSPAWVPIKWIIIKSTVSGCSIAKCLSVAPLHWLDLPLYHKENKYGFCGNLNLLRVLQFPAGVKISNNTSMNVNQIKGQENSFPASLYIFSVSISRISVYCLPWYQWVPGGRAQNMYLNELEGAIPHCVMCSTPSIHPRVYLVYAMPVDRGGLWAQVIVHRPQQWICCLAWEEG